MKKLNSILYVAVDGKVYGYELVGELDSISESQAVFEVPDPAQDATVKAKSGPKKAAKKKVKAKASKKKMGRPKGSKNKPKVETASVEPSIAEVETVAAVADEPAGVPA